MSVTDVIPSPAFEVLDARPGPLGGTPTLELILEVTEPSGALVYTIALHTKIGVEPARRAHDGEARERLTELFGPGGRSTAGTVHWLSVDMLVPSFTGRTSFTLTVPIGYDLEVSATRYCDGLREGEIPLDLHFNGSVFHRDPEGRLQIVLVPWSATARYALPYEVWREAIERHYPNGGWIALQRDTLAALREYRTQEGMPSFDACVQRLLG